MASLIRNGFVFKASRVLYFGIQTVVAYKLVYYLNHKRMKQIRQINILYTV